MGCATMRHRKAILGVAIVLAGVATWGTYRVLHTIDVSEGYAAWDTGTLLVEYMKGHEGRWPDSWEELLTVLDSESGREVLMRGASAGDLEYARTLREKVAVDWSFDPSRPGQKRPVTRRDGSAFPFVWEEPNEMVREYLKSATTQPSRME